MDTLERTHTDLRRSTDATDRQASGHSRRGILRGGGALAAGAALAAGWATPARAQTMDPEPEPDGRADPDGRFAGKVVLITGATSGIGRAAAEEFARAGASVCFCGRREELGAEVEAGIRGFGGEAAYLRADVREPEQVAAFVAAAIDRYGGLDIAFNNAGIFMTPGEVQEITVENYLDMMLTNAGGVFFAMQHEIPALRERGGGAIVNMASVAGHRGFGNTAHYNASKHAVIGMTKAAAAANARLNIRVTSLSPLAVDTPMLRESFEFQGVTYEEMAPNFVTPRIMTAYEMALAVMFLADPGSTFVNGMDLDVTGGQLA